MNTGSSTKKSGDRLDTPPPLDTIARNVQRPHWLLVVFSLAGLIIAIGASITAGLKQHLLDSLAHLLLLVLLFTLGLLIKSLIDFSLTGPSIRDEIQRSYRLYSIYSLLRLAFWACLLLFLMGCAGILVYAMLSAIGAVGYHSFGVIIAATLGILTITVFQFARQLLLLPASLCTSLNYLPSRLYPFWNRLSSEKLRRTTLLFTLLAVLLAFAAISRLLLTGQSAAATAIVGSIVFFVGLLTWARWEPEPAPVSYRAKKPNVVMIGSDTLRADRLGAAGYSRNLTPAIDSISAHGTQFTNCYVPCARTAPSLVSLLTGTWPFRTGIRDNFVAGRETRLPVAALPEILKRQGYLTAAISDWCGADLGKFSFGFDLTDLPEDQWNIKYLIRQGPKDMRLFLSLFTHNRFGRYFLPEIYYLGGVPLTRQIGLSGRRAISALAETGQPFFLNIFLSSTHPPFGSDYPYYTLYADPTYQGESKFVMSRLTDPFEIIRRQGEAKTEFDLDQIIDLYDGCVRSFDDEVARILRHLEVCGLAKDTLLVIYSDHGMEFFENETWGQGNSAIGDSSPRIPLIINNPRSNGEGRVVDRVVRSIDLAPTLLDLLDIEIPDSMDGLSLAPYLNGELDDMGLVAYNETGIWLTDVPGMPRGHLSYPTLLEMLEVPDKRTGVLSIKPEYITRIIRAKDRMVRRGRWKLVYQPLMEGPRFMLFDVTTDTECLNNLLGQYPDIAMALCTLLTELVEPDGILASDLKLNRTGESEPTTGQE